MDERKLTDPNEEPDWFREFMSSDSDELNIPSSQSPAPEQKDDFDFDIEFPWMKKEPQEEASAEQEPEEEPYAEVLAEESTVEEVPVENEPLEEEPKPAIRKVRPKRKGGYGLFGLPHLVSTVIWLVLAVTIGISLGRLLWRCATDILAFGREDQTIYITITDNDNIDSITQKLYNSGLIEYPSLFKFYASLSNAEESISAGTFKLNSLYDYHALVNGMSATSSYRESKEVLIPEGYSCAQIFKLLEEKGICTAEKLEEYAAESEFADYWFLAGVERGDKYCLEGFLFPDTYEFYTNATPKQVFIKFLDRFEDQLDDEIEDHIAALNERLATTMKRRGYSDSEIEASKFDLYDVITIASMIEKESAHTGENYDISSVIFNRLTNKKEYPYLQIDATIVYALGGKSPLTEEDLQLESEYNSYKYSGLPPTPIANPGKSSILAALSPANTEYHYYALDPSTNEHYFSKNYKEHTDFLESLKK